MVGAARLLDRAMTIDAHQPDAAVAVGALMLSINQFEAAEANLENAGKLGSAHPNRTNLLAMAQLGQGKEVANSASLVSALDMRKLALAHCRGQDFENAETWLRRAIDMEQRLASEIESGVSGKRTIRLEGDDGPVPHFNFGWSVLAEKEERQKR